MKLKQLTPEQFEEVIDRIKQEIGWLEVWENFKETEFYSCNFVKNVVFYDISNDYKPIFESELDNQNLVDLLQKEYRKVTRARTGVGFRRYTSNQWHEMSVETRNKYRVKKNETIP